MYRKKERKKDNSNIMIKVNGRFEILYCKQILVVLL